jgi:hypothetical protein
MAASAQQISANRKNAQLSTGPQNTARTKFNGVSHGMTSRQTVIPGESQAEYDSFHASLTNQLGPGSETEKLLADRIAVAAWRLRRFTRMEAAFFNNRIDAYLEANPDQDPDAALANLFCDAAEATKMRLFLRYQTAVQREYDTAWRMLDKARKERAQQEFLHATQPEQLPHSEIGFASQPAPHDPQAAVGEPDQPITSGSAFAVSPGGVRLGSFNTPASCAQSQNGAASVLKMPATTPMDLGS